MLYRRMPQNGDKLSILGFGCMDTQDALKQLLAGIRDGSLSVEQGMEWLRDFPYLDIGHTKIDLHRSLRNGFPEVIYGEGKTPAQVGEIFVRMAAATAPATLSALML